MTYCNMDIDEDIKPLKSRGKSLFLIEAELRAQEIQHMRDHPDEPMPVLLKDAIVKWPEKF